MSQNKFVEEPRHALDMRFQKKMRRRLNGLLNAQIQDDRGNVIGTVDYADGNTIFKFKSSSSNAQFGVFAITELGHQDYFIARQLSNVRLEGGAPTADVGDTDIKIAKPKIVRRSIVAELLYSDSVTYTDDDPADIDNTRNADNGVDPTEAQVCLPPYITTAALGLSDTVPMNAQCVVYAKKLTGMTGVFDDDGTQLDWIEETDGVRAFAERDPDPS